MLQRWCLAGGLLVLLAAVVVLLAPGASATHLQGAALEWHDTAKPNEVVFNLTVEVRASLVAPGPIGAYYPRALWNIDFGDGTSVTPGFKVRVVDEEHDVVRADAKVWHTYGAGSWKASLTSDDWFRQHTAGERIHTLLINNDHDLRVTANVNPGKGGSPDVVAPLVVDCFASVLCTHALHASDGLPGLITWSMTSDLASFLDPNPGLVVSPTGNLTWNTPALRFPLSQRRCEYYAVSVDATNSAGTSAAAFLVHVNDPLQACHPSGTPIVVEECCPDPCAPPPAGEIEPGSTMGYEGKEGGRVNCDVPHYTDYENGPPVLDPTNDELLASFAYYEFPLTASDPDGDPLAWSFWALGGATHTWDSATHTVSGYMPGWGTVCFQAAVRDPTGLTDEGGFCLKATGTPGRSDVQPETNDVDGDGIQDIADNCPGIDNRAQGDADDDGRGDACALQPAQDESVTDVEPASPAFTIETPWDCSVDRDCDHVLAGVDLCPDFPDPLQGDIDHDGLGDACDEDRDDDGIPQSARRGVEIDNCPDVSNVDQADADGDGRGDACASAALLGGEACDGCAPTAKQARHQASWWLPAAAFAATALVAFLVGRSLVRRN